jgi:hypothetical protein
MFADLPLHSWFFLCPDGQFPKYKCDQNSFEGWNIRWATPIDPATTVYEAVFCQQEKVYVPKCSLDTSIKKTTKEWGRL